MSNEADTLRQEVLTLQMALTSAMENYHFKEVELIATRQKLERAEAEVRMADKISKGHVAKIDRLRRDLSREFDRTQKAESALATARNRALEEAAEHVRGMPWFRKETQAHIRGNGPADYASAILSLRTPEASNVPEDKPHD